MQIDSNLLVESNYHKKPIVTDVFYVQNNLKKPIVIFCHGYKGFKDWGAWNLLAKSFSENQCFFIKFNFSHNGGTPNNPIDFSDLTAFSENNFTIELHDLEDVINWVVKKKEYENEIDTSKIILIGHSRGGGIVTIKASENNRISKIITLNGVSDFKERFPKGLDLKAWKDSGVFHILNARTNQEMPHNYQFYQNFKNNEERLTIKNAIKKLMKPMLVVNGDDDSVVLAEEGIKMQLWNPKIKRTIVKGMNHTLGSKHPWVDNQLPVHLEETFQICLDFIK